jgi:hypothetical protein
VADTGEPAAYLDAAYAPPYGGAMPAGHDDFRYCTAEATVGIRLIRSLSDADVLAAARDTTSAAHTVVPAQMGPATSRSWIRSRAEKAKAYLRHLIDEVEMDYITA